MKAVRKEDGTETINGAERRTKTKANPVGFSDLV
jgi:hypothetical protein